MTLDDFVEDDGGIDSNESYYGSSASSDEDGDDSHMQGMEGMECNPRPIDPYCLPVRN